MTSPVVQMRCDGIVPTLQLTQTDPSSSGRYASSATTWALSLSRSFKDGWKTSPFVNAKEREVVDRPLGREMFLEA